MDGVVRVNLANFITVGLISLVFILSVKWAVNSWAPSYAQYV